MARLIDADALMHELTEMARYTKGVYKYCMEAAKRVVMDAPTIDSWISVKDGLPSEHNSIFANHTHLSKHMWAMESNNVIVYVRFPDVTGRSTEGGLHDGKWWTRISPTLEPVVTHWKPFNEPPEEVTKDENC